MENGELILLLNRDIADEHSAILRYLVHAYQEGEGTPLGANLLSRSREEMWHMHWLGLIIADLGGEPEMKPAPYPYDPTNRRTIFQSYIDYELKLIPHYNGQANLVGDPHIKRVLQREAWESAMHAKKFQRLMAKMKPEAAEGRPGGEREIPEDLVDHIQKEVSAKYLDMLQHVRSSWVFQSDGMLGWRIMDQSMEKMKQLAHFAEVVAENGAVPEFAPYDIQKAGSVKTALERARADTVVQRERHAALRKNPEFEKNAGMVINLDLTLDQEAFNEAEIEDWLKK